MWFTSFFFFSSRRRHTRLTCDWSSDVCSSDLAADPDYRPDLGEPWTTAKVYWCAMPRSVLQAGIEALDKAGEKTLDRKSTRLNSSHMSISYAVFCLKKKKMTPGSPPTS